MKYKKYVVSITVWPANSFQEDFIVPILGAFVGTVMMFSQYNKKNKADCRIEKLNPTK